MEGRGAIIVNCVWVSYIFVFVMESFCLRAEMLGLDVELGLGLPLSSVHG